MDTSYALPIHLDDVARIEVIRGPVSSVYGTNAFLGIINIVTLGADKAPPVYGRVGGDSFGSATGNAGFGYGTVDRQVRGNVAWVRRGGENGLNYVPEDTANQFETGADRLDALNGAVQVHYDRLFFQVRGHTRTRQLPGAPYDSLQSQEGNENTDRQIMAEVGYTRDIAEILTLTGRLYADAYQFRGLLEYASGIDETRTFESDGNSLWYGGEVRGLFDMSPYMPEDGKLDLTLGVAAEFSDTDSSSFTRDMPETTTVDINRDFNIQGVYGELNIEPIEWVAATAGVRLDLNSEFENNVSPRTALFLKRGEQVGAKFLYAQGFRNPSIFEAFFQDGERYRPACIPQCDLQSSLFPELITSFEGVVWARPLPGIKIRVSAWQWDVEKLIEKRRVFDPTDLAERLQYQNLAFLTSRGAEFEGSYRDTRGWFGFANVSIADVIRNEGDAPNAPVAVAKAGVSSPLILDTFHVSSDVSYISERLTRDEDLSADAHMTWNAAVYVPSFRGFDVTVGARNLIGTRQEIPAQADYDRQGVGGDILLIPGPGREFFGRVGYRF